MKQSRMSRPGRWWSVALLVIGLALAAAMVPLGVRLIPGMARTGPTARYAFMVGYSVVWIIVGYLATKVRPAARLGPLMMVFGLADLLGTAGNAFYGEGLGFRVARTAAAVITVLQGALVVQMAVTYPHGRATDHPTRWLLRGIWAFAIADAAATLASLRPPAEIGPCARRPCTEHLFYLIQDDSVQDAIQFAGGLGWAMGILAGLAVLGLRWLTATPRVRRLRALPVAVTVVTGVLAVMSLTGAAIDHRLGVTGGPLFDQLLIATLLAIPVVFLIGLLRERLDLARVSDLVRQLGAVPLESLRPALAAALGDPRLEVVSSTGTVAADAGRAVTPIGDPDAPVAVLLHDASLRDEPRLLEAVRAAVALAADNSRLRAQLHEQLAQVRASRARLVEAGDAARRRLERDLHDGAQQRLIAAGLALRAARTRRGSTSPDDNADGLLDAAEDELRSAIADLRELARGIHPAVLTEQGLAAAVEQLVARQRYPVTLLCAQLPRLDAQVQATAYFVISEALTNVDKHAHATRVELRITVSERRLEIVVADDGAGGASPAPGSGLAGLADRVAAANGEIDLRSPAGGGTTLRVVLPCG
jgi:signal transduction histidine kinase